MGKVLSVLNRKVNRFNVENRAHRVISKGKPTPAPRHPSNVKSVEEFYADNPGTAEEQMTKNSLLEDRLKQVYVVSHDPKTKSPEVEHISAKPAEDFGRENKLPLDRQPYVEAEYGIHEPVVIPRGRCSLRQAIKFISDHQTDPAAWTASSIAQSYKISQENVDNVLKHYRTFEVFLPESKNRTHQPLVAGPTSRENIEGGKDARP